MECAFEAVGGQVLWGADGSFEHTMDLTHEEKVLGTFRYSSEKALLIFDTLKLLFQKEWEKKKIGKEVLGLYREINMIYDLSELISEKIDAESIAKVTLEEASQIIDTTHALFLIYDPEKDKVLQIARLGENPKSQAFIEQQKDVLAGPDNPGGFGYCTC